MTSTAMAIDAQREARTIELHNRKGEELDLADLSESEFERGLERLKTVQTRMKRILETALVEDAHYGNPKTSSGKSVFKKPILYQAGAEELARLLRLTPVRVGDLELTEGPDYVSATVTIAHQDTFGRLVCPRVGSCNSREKRFKKFDGSGFVYDDPREAVHDIVSMAQKRAMVASMRAASGATAFLAAEDAMDEATADKVMTPWTAQEKKDVYDAASKKGLSRNQFAALIEHTLGRTDVGTGDDVKALLEAIAKWEKPAKGDPQRGEVKAKMEGKQAPLSADGYEGSVPGDAHEADA